MVKKDFDVQVIPAREPVFVDTVDAIPKKRVAAYCRVSTDEEQQQTSFELQVEYYTKLIADREDWMLAGIYADEGISGTQVKHREQFQQMIEDCRDHKIDMIITKSISRFARNVVDCLTTIRELKNLSPPVNIYFEKERIDSLDEKTEIYLTMLASFAQEESRSISTNIRWAIRNRMKEGTQKIVTSSLLGYDTDEDYNMVIIEQEAKIVRLIYETFLKGEHPAEIADRLNSLGFTTVLGNPWSTTSVKNILRNEKYCGKVYFLGIAIFAGQTVMNIYNMYYKYKLVPLLHVSLKMVKKDAIKDLLSSGVWNAFSRAGGLLETGLDLLLSNVLLDANTMGILSVSKSMPGIVNELNYSLANVFLPSMVRDYAKEDKKAIVSSIKSSAKILSVICSIPLCYLIVFGKEFYSLWQPTLDAKLLQELSVLTCLSYVFITGATSLLNIFTTYNKVKQNSLSVIIMGVLSLILTIVFVKFTNLGVFAIAGISSVLNILRFLVFVIPYSAKCLNEKWYTFYSIVFQSVVTVVLSSLCGFVLKRFIICDTWVKLIFMAFLFCIISFIITIFVVLNKNERKSFMLLFQNLLNKIR